LLQDNVPKLIKEWLGGAEDSFLLFHTAEYIHEPYFADKELVEKFLDDDTRKEADTESKIVQTLTSRNASGNSIREVMGAINQRVSKPAQADVKYLLSCYDAGICHVDKIMGGIYDVVKQCGDEYLFILAADHGQAFMEHRVMGHGFHL
jgi:arylsulfatase A-like enzyme